MTPRVGAGTETAIVVLLSVVALIVRWYYVLHLTQHHDLGFDSAYYELVAKELRSGHGFLDPFAFYFGGREVSSALFPPGFPLLLAGLSYIGLAGSHTKNLLVGATLGVVNVVLVWHVARRIAGRTVALLALVLVAAHPLLVAADGALMAEPLGLLLALALVELLLSVEDAAWTRWLLIGLIGGLIILVRGEGVAVFAGLLAAAVWTCRRTGWRRPLVGSAIAVIVVAVVLAPWLVRNHHVFGKVVFANNVSTVLGGANCTSTYYGQRVGFWDHACLHADRPGWESMSETELNDRIRHEAVDFVRSHQRRTVVVVPVRILRTWAAFHPFEQVRWEASEGRLVGWGQAAVVYLWMLTPLALIGLPRLARRRGALLVLILPVVVTVTSALTYGNQRFRVVAEPAIVILAACGLATVGQWLTKAASTTRLRMRERGRVRSSRRLAG